MFGISMVVLGEEATITGFSLRDWRRLSRRDSMADGEEA